MRVKELLKKKQAGEKIEAPRESTPAKVITLMDALRRTSTRRVAALSQEVPSSSASSDPKKAGRIRWLPALDINRAGHSSPRSRIWLHRAKIPNSKGLRWGSFHCHGNEPHTPLG